MIDFVCLLLKVLTFGMRHRAVLVFKPWGETLKPRRGTQVHPFSLTSLRQ